VVSEDTDRGVQVRIEDTGIGMDEEDLRHVFDEFYRSKKAKEVTRDGSGLGLVIAKVIIERHGGTIHAESEGLGKGSTFVIDIPGLARKAGPGGSDSAGWSSQDSSEH